MGSSFIHHENWFKCILFNGWVIFHCVYVSQLPYPFVCWWATRFLPCPGYYKQCRDEHWGARVSFRSGFFGVYAQEWVAQSYGSSISWFNIMLAVGFMQIFFIKLKNFPLVPSLICVFIMNGLWMLLNAFMTQLIW